MSTALVLSERDLRQQVVLDAAVIDCVEQALASLAREDVVMPPIMHLAIAPHNGEVDVKTAYVPGIDSFAIKISPGFFDNPKLGLPSLNGLMVLFSANTGIVEALLLDNGYLTDVRTAAAGAVAAKWMARAQAERAAVLGGGTQARLQLKALTLVRPIKQAKLWARRWEQASAVAQELSDELGITVQAVAEARQAVEDADVIVTATPSREPLLQPDWLSPGQHVTAVGADAEYKNELAPMVLAQAQRYICDRVSQCAALGELHHAVATGAVAADAEWPEIAQVIAGAVVGRAHDDEITVADLTGTGVQDTAIAALAHARCVAAGAGTTFELTD